MHRLLNSSAMRIALRYAGIYAIFMTLGLSVLYWTSSRYVDEQISAGLQQSMSELIRIDTEKGRDKLIATLNTQQADNIKQQRHFLLLNPEQKKIAGDLQVWPQELAINSHVVNVWIADKSISKQGTADGYWPMIAATLNDGSRLLLAQSLEQAEELQEVILYTIITILLVSVGLALTMGWFIGRTLLARIDKVNMTAKAISSGNFSQRVPLSERNDEFDELAIQLNTMLVRIEQLLTGMRQVTDNIAHDLRQPLSRLRNRLEITLLEKRDTPEYQQVLGETIEDADELIRTFNALLEIAQTEAGSFRGEWQTVDMSALLAGLGELYQELAASQGKKLTINIQQGLKVTGNHHLLAQAISNLLDNAIKYTENKGRIMLSAKQQAKRIIVQISDHGLGIPLEKHALVLERFYRLDTARSTTGNGLGLSLVKAVLELHGATFKFEDNKPGLKVTLDFINL
ncbi:sensor histidine kinase [Methyloprofundus sedimenti]|uniref:sensor histidine kinase n=1 Tax=Methyloprofundus sedimenti TaxID=1420851 RepID=UPI001E38CB5A|nr:ATP-binding protein [Methyloprofundus sedimenti]